MSIDLAADRPCPLWCRLLALIYDLLIVVALVMVVGLLCQLATAGRLIGTGAQAHVPAWYQLLQALVVAGYFISSWLRGGQTIGMRPWHVRLTDRAGTAVSLRQTLLRTLVAAAPLLVLALAPTIGLRGALWTLLALWATCFAPALVDPRRRTLQDMAAGTELRRLA